MYIRSLIRRRGRSPRQIHSERADRPRPRRSAAFNGGARSSLATRSQPARRDVAIWRGLIVLSRTLNHRALDGHAPPRHFRGRRPSGHRVALRPRPATSPSVFTRFPRHSSRAALRIRAGIRADDRDLAKRSGRWCAPRLVLETTWILHAASICDRCYSCREPARLPPLLGHGLSRRVARRTRGEDSSERRWASRRRAPSSTPPFRRTLAQEGSLLFAVQGDESLLMESVINSPTFPHNHRRLSSPTKVFRLTASYSIATESLAICAFQAHYNFNEFDIGPRNRKCVGTDRLTAIVGISKSYLFRFALKILCLALRSAFNFYIILLILFWQDFFARDCILYLYYANVLC